MLVAVERYTPAVATKHHARKREQQQGGARRSDSPTCC